MPVEEPAAAEPACSEPAKLEGHLDERAPGVFITLKADLADPIASARALASRYGFQITDEYSSERVIFVEKIAATMIEKLRCEPEIELLSYNTTTSLASR